MTEINTNTVEKGPNDMGLSDVSKAASLMGKIGGLKGGPASAKKLTPKQRKDKARKASNTRWANQKKKK